MSFLDKLKDKIVGRKYYEPEPADFDTVRSAVLGDNNPPYNPQPAQQKPSLEIRKPGWRTGTEAPIQDQNAPESIALPSIRAPEQEQFHPESQSSEFHSQSLALQRRDDDKHKWNRRDYYELFDRLAIIEAQLTAIRSQTETINERLRMLEARLSRRY